MKEKIIVALDVESAREAREYIDELREFAGAFKIGLQLFTSAGPDFVRKIVESGVKIFLDLKFHDIPNTVAKASVEAARLGVWMFNIHALGGGEMMRRTIGEVAEVSERENIRRPKVIGVTVLTSAAQETLSEVGIDREINSEVLNLARLTAKCGLDGVVISPKEIRDVRQNIDEEDFLIVTPGIRPLSATNDDQKRVTTPAAAVGSGADYLVIGRPILTAKDRIAAIEGIRNELENK